MLTKEKLNRLNELARKAKRTTLSPSELDEQMLLRREYIENFRAEFRSQLDRIEIVDDGDGDKRH